jgi:hypothetical protein
MPLARTRPLIRAFLATLVIIALTAALRFPLLAVPLDRDEGEYAYTATRLLQGVPPYADAYTLKTPGVHAAYAAIMAAFGAHPAGIHLGLLIANAATIALLAALGIALIGPVTGVAAAAVYAVLSSGETLLGTAANAEHFVVLPALAGLLLLVLAVDRGRRAWLVPAGLLIGAAPLVKQSGAFFVLAAMAYLAIAPWRQRAVHAGRSGTAFLIFAGAAVLPAIALCAWLAWAGVWPRFWFWTVSYASEYGRAIPLRAALLIAQARLPEITAPAWPLWLLALGGVAATACDPRVRRRDAFLACLALCSLLAPAVGFYFRPPYFILLLPAVALLAGIAIDALHGRLARTPAPRLAAAALAVTVAALLGHAVWMQRAYFFQMTPTMVARALYGGNPFPESIEVARYLRERSAPDDRIAVLGSEPQIYFYAGRRAATGYLHAYPLMEIQPFALDMQREMIREIEAARPAYIVLVGVAASWLLRPGSETLVHAWFEDYQQRHYERVGVVDILSPTFSLYLWDAASRDYTPRSNVWLSVYRRRDLPRVAGR